MRQGTPQFESQRGQTLPIGLALIFFAVLGILLLYNTSQLTSEKSRLANTADAAAYSGLVLQARALNFQAYTNRAMVANELSIAQIVSLNAWTQYGAVTSRNINNTIGLIPVVRPFTQGVASAAETADEVVSTIATAGVGVVSGLNLILSETQRGVYLGTFVMTPEVVKAVIEANDPTYTFGSDYSMVSMGRNILAWKNFTQRYDDPGGQARLADLINRSRHEFVSDRGWSTPALPVLPIPPTQVRLIKEGATQLEHNDGQWVWRARDTLSLHQEIYRCKAFDCGWRRTEIPIGWGEVFAGDDRRCQSIRPDTHQAGFQYRFACGQLSPRNRKAGRAARAENDGIDGYGGLRAYQDLRDLSGDNKDPRLLLRVKVGQPQAALRTAARLGIGADPATETSRERPSTGIGRGMFRLEDNLASNELQSVSSAELYFKRPDHDVTLTLTVNGARKREYASLFNPYWQVRLAPTPQQERIMAWADNERGRAVVSGMATQSGNALSRYVDRQQAEFNGIAALAEAAVAEIARISEYTQQLARVSRQLDNTSDRLNELRRQVETAQPGSDAETTAQTALDAALRTQSGFADQVEALEQRLELAQLYASQQQQFEQYVTTVADQAQSQLPPQLAGLAQHSDAAFAHWESIRNLNLNDIEVEAGRVIADLGADYLNQIVADYAMDQAKDMLQGALTAILQRYGGSYAQKLEQIQEKAEAIKQTAENLGAEAIGPLVTQLEALQTNVQSLRDAMQREAASFAAEIQQEIELLRDSVAQAVDDATMPLRDEVNQLNNQLGLLEAGQERDRVVARIESLEAEINDATRRAGAALQSDVAQLIAAKDQMVADTAAAVETEINKIERDIADLREKITSLQDRLG